MLCRLNQTAAVTAACLLVAATTRAEIVYLGAINPDPPQEGQSLLVGDQAEATLEINGGSSFSTGTADDEQLGIGFAKGFNTGDGLVRVTGSGSTLRTENLRVGLAGRATFVAEAGAEVYAGNFYLSNESNRGNTATVTGDGTLMEIVGAFEMNSGSMTDGNVFTVTDGATLRFTGDSLRSIATPNNTVATFNVSNGARVEFADTAGNEMLIGWYDGAQGTMNVTGGSTVELGFTRLGGFGSAQGVLSVSGDGSRFSTVGNNSLVVGRQARGELKVLDGGVVTAGADLNIAGESGARGTATVSSSSSVTSTNWFNVGVGDRSEGTLNILDGSSVTSGSRFRLAGGGDSIGTVNIDGGSTLTINERFYLNALGSSTANLNVTEGIVDVADLTITGLRGGVSNIYLGSRSAINLVKDIYVSYNSGSQTNFEFELTSDDHGTPRSGTITLFGLAFLSGQSSLDFDLASDISFEQGDSFILFDYANTRWNGKTFDNVGDDEILLAGGYQFLINYDDLIGIDDYAVTATVVVPEPASVVLLTAGVGLIVSRRRRKAIA